MLASARCHLCRAAHVFGVGASIAQASRRRAFRCGSLTHSRLPASLARGHFSAAILHGPMPDLHRSLVALPMSDTKLGRRPFEKPTARACVMKWRSRRRQLVGRPWPTAPQRHAEGALFAAKLDMHSPDADREEDIHKFDESTLSLSLRPLLEHGVRSGVRWRLHRAACGDWRGRRSRALPGRDLQRAAPPNPSPTA